MKIAWSLLSLVLNVIMGQRNIDSILVRNISAVIPAGTVKIFDFELGFRARSNLQTVKASDFTGVYYILLILSFNSGIKLLCQHLNFLITGTTLFCHYLQ
jgi:hypothetical protein